MKTQLPSAVRNIIHPVIIGKVKSVRPSKSLHSIKVAKLKVKTKHIKQ